MLARSTPRASTWYAATVAVWFLIVFSELAAASVTSVGSVNPVPPASGGTFSGSWVVGDQQASNSDIRAWVQINNGTTLQYSTMVIGDEEGYFGEVNVIGNFPTGTSSQLNLSASALAGTPTAQIGQEGTGYLNISGGATMNLSSIFSDMSIGVEDSGVGHVTVTDAFSLMTVSEDLIVGENGLGYLDVLNGALVRTTQTSAGNSITIGSEPTGIGTVLVDGPASVLRVASNLVVGGLGLGTLTISDQGMVDADNQFSRTVTVGPGGRLILDNGTIQTLETFVDGYVAGSGLVRGTVDFSDNAALEAGNGDLLRFDGDVSSNASATINQGEIQFLGEFTNNDQGLLDAPGRISLENGTVRFFEPLTNDGVISSAHGNNNLHGDITNQGYIVVAGNSVATFYDPYVDNGGTLDVLPGSTALFLADMMFQTMSTLQLSVGIDENMMDNSSQLSTGGEMTLAGDLVVDLSDNYTPVLGQSFTLLTAAGGINGTFDNSTLPDIPGTLEFGLLYDATSVRLEVQLESTSIGLDGDYNNDGEINAADYSVWRDALTAGSSSLINDPTPGTVDESDFLYWRAHFGETAPFGAGSGAGTVPEPTSQVLMLLGILVTAKSCNWRRG